MFQDLTVKHSFQKQNVDNFSTIATKNGEENRSDTKKEI